MYEKVTEVRAEIDAAEGRMKYLGALSSMATVTIELLPPLIQPAPPPPPAPEPAWSLQAIASGAWGDMVGRIQGITGAVVYFLIAVVPPFIMLALPFVLVGAVVQLLRRRGFLPWETPRQPRV
jgi:hypothetical protein